MTKRTIFPLAISSIARPNGSGKLRCVGIYQKAINFVTDDNQLFTLHCYGSGISPMGWLLRKTDFHFIIHLITHNTLNCYINKQGINIGLTCISSQARQVNLALHPKNTTISFNELTHQLTLYSAETGLFGPINDAIQLQNNSLKSRFIDLFTALFTPSSYNKINQDHLVKLIGLGPGLTPSSDDMLIGMMAVMHYYSLVTEHTYSYFELFQKVDKIEQLTTIVSRNFLFFASKGYFSSSFLAFFNAINSQEKLSRNIQRLLTYGHTSGADSLFGVWLGIGVIHHYLISEPDR